MRRPGNSLWLSTATHVLFAATLFAALRHLGPVVHPLRMPGTPKGQQLMLTYNLGGPTTAASAIAALPKANRTPKTSATKSPTLAVQTPAAPPAASPGTGASGNSALGDGNLRIALPQVHPRPQPDLSTLPHGTAGDVIVDVTIDNAGVVVDTTLVKGLGPAVDATVMATLRGWVFTPANRDGENVASQQEILIHYEHA